MSNMWNRFLRWLAGEDGGARPESRRTTALTAASTPRSDLATMVVGADSDRQFALLTVSGHLRDAMVSRYREHYARTGNMVGHGGKVAPGAILSIAGAAGGSAGLSTAMAGNLFIATANPATLMAIKGGVGSAVVGANGAIIAQAPFIAASGAIVPVVIPLVAFQAISTYMTMRQFALVRKDLARIEKAIGRVIHRSEATYAAELVALSQRLESLEEQFADERQFSTDMIVRLGLIEERVDALCERYKLLDGAQDIVREATQADLDFKVHDARMAIVASSLGLRVGYLRLALSLQESPGRSSRTVEQFVQLCERHEALLQAVRKDGRDTVALSRELDASVEAMNWYNRNMPGWMFGSRAERVENEKASEMLQQVRERQLEVEHQEIAAAATLGAQARQAIEGSEDLALVYWKDELGEHAYVVDELPFAVH